VSKIWGTLQYDGKQPTAVLEKDTIFLRGGGHFMKAGSVISKTGDCLSSPEMKDKKVTVYVQNKRLRKMTYNETANLIKELSNIK